MTGTVLDPFRYPAKIQVQTHNRCNFACGMCPYPSLQADQSRAEMDESLFRSIVDDVVAEGETVKLCLMLQNEPLLDRRFVGFLDYAHEAEEILTVSTVTNGSTLTPAFLDQLMSYERFRLTISVNATDAERYRAVHGRDMWDRLFQLLSTWGGPRQRVRVSFVIDDDSVPSGRDFDRFWRDHGYTTRFVPLNSRTGASPADPTISRVEPDFGYCHYPVDTLTVLCGGGVILCCNDWRHARPFGNLRESSIGEVWRRDELVRLRTAAIDGRLRQCSAVCRGCDYPMRSARRVQLEARLDGSGGPPSGLGATVAHWTSLLPAGAAAPLPFLLSGIDPGSGRIAGLLARLPTQIPSDVALELRIGHDGVFDFGALRSLWCRGRLCSLDRGEALGEQVPVVVDLDPAAPEFRFLSWYAEDWRADAASPPVPMPTEEVVEPPISDGSALIDVRV